MGTGSLNNARGRHTATLLSDGMVLAAGGLDFPTINASTELYNPPAPTSTPTPTVTPTQLYTDTLLAHQESIQGRVPLRIPAQHRTNPDSPVIGDQ